jgi:hypothetical protein
VNVEGKWIGLDEFLTSQLDAKVSYGVSPEAMQEILNLEKSPEPAASWPAPQEGKVLSVPA